MALRIEAKNYRGLREAGWSLEPGVSLLVGPNGSGKSTLLDVVALLSDALRLGVRQAVDDHGGPGTIVNLRAADGEAAGLCVRAGEVSWSFLLQPQGVELGTRNVVSVHGKKAVLAYPLLATHGQPSVQLIDVGVASDALFSPELTVLATHAPDLVRPLTTALSSYFLHGGYWIRALRLNGSRVSSDTRLDRDGTNVFSVLRNWRDARATRARWDFVVAGLKDAFPDLFEELEFESAGQTTAAKIYAPRSKVAIGSYFAPDGLLTGLLHLAAVASTPEGGTVAIDEFENSLHPFAIRALLDHTRAWADAHGISVILATHSPVLIDQFKESPEKLFVMDPGAPVVPVPVTQMRDPEWLAHFSLGDLYARGEFGAQASR